jgi:hypothetical protein
MNYSHNKSELFCPHSRPRTRLTRSPIMADVDTPRSLSQTIPTDPASLWDMSKRILFHVAKKVRQAVRLQLNGHGRGEAEAEELVHDAFICVVEASPRFKPAAAKLTTFVYGLARRRMWLVARAAFYGLSPEQLHRMDTAKRTPRQPPRPRPCLCPRRSIRTRPRCWR